MTKWFYQTDQNIKGPVTTTELKNLIPQLSDARQTFVWSRGHTEWILNLFNLQRNLRKHV
jgi:hypothetical protein